MPAISLVITSGPFMIVRLTLALLRFSQSRHPGNHGIVFGLVETLGPPDREFAGRLGAAWHQAAARRDRGTDANQCPAAV